MSTPRTKAEQSEATMAALMAAARALFAERGYAGVGTEEIVQQAGVTRGALYHHFRGGKEELFRAVLVQVSAETTRRVIAAANTAADPWEELVVGTDAFLDACTRPEVQRIMLIDGPAVLGWDMWREADGNIALGLLEAALKHVGRRLVVFDDYHAGRRGIGANSVLYGLHFFFAFFVPSVSPRSQRIATMNLEGRSSRVFSFR